MRCRMTCLIARLALLSIILVSVPLPASAQAEVGAGPWRAEVHVLTPVYQLEAATLTVAGFGTEDRPGAPTLPVWSTLIALPAVGEPQISYDASEEQHLDVERTLAAVPVPQVGLVGPAGLSDFTDTVVMLDRPDPAIYAQAALYPAEPVSFGPVQWQRGRRLLPVARVPVPIQPAHRRAALLSRPANYDRSGSVGARRGADDRRPRRHSNSGQSAKPLHA